MLKKNVKTLDSNPRWLNKSVNSFLPSHPTKQSNLWFCKALELTMVCFKLKNLCFPVQNYLSQVQIQGFSHFLLLVYLLCWSAARQDQKFHFEMNSHIFTCNSKSCLLAYLVRCTARPQQLYWVLLLRLQYLFVLGFPKICNLFCNFSNTIQYYLEQKYIDSILLASLFKNNLKKTSQICYICSFISLINSNSLNLGF